MTGCGFIHVDGLARVNETVFPLWKRGIEGDVSTGHPKSPLAPLFQRGGTLFSGNAVFLVKNPDA
jgi:hypothetical protein